MFVEKKVPDKIPTKYEIKYGWVTCSVIINESKNGEGDVSRVGPEVMEVSFEINTREVLG